MPIQVESATPLFAVYDVPTSVAFYRDILGFEVLDTSTPFTSAKDDFGWCLIKLNTVNLMPGAPSVRQYYRRTGGHRAKLDRLHFL